MSVLGRHHEPEPSVPSRGSDMSKNNILTASGWRTRTSRCRQQRLMRTEPASLPASRRIHVRRIRKRSGGSNGIRHPLQRPADPRRGAPAGRLGRRPAADAWEILHSYPFFAALGGLVVRGPTGSNLMDVYLGVVG
jgi:hypothetical protein